MAAPITALYAGLLALLVLVLAIRVVRARQTGAVAFGDGGNAELQKRIRVHGNAIENVPIGLILLLVLELNGSSALLLHGIGASLTVGRVAHAQGLGTSTGATPGRFLGTVITWVAIGVAAAVAIGSFVVSPRG
jgi:uncharacterized protein